MILIGGVATISGSIMGALFITLLPRVTRELPAVLPFICGSATTGGLTVFTVETVLYGLLIIVLPDLRTARAVRHLGPDPQLLEVVAVLALRSA